MLPSYLNIWALLAKGKMSGREILVVTQVGDRFSQLVPQAELDAGWDSRPWDVGMSLSAGLGPTHPCNWKSVSQSVPDTSFIPPTPTHTSTK